MMTLYESCQMPHDCHSQRGRHLNRIKTRIVEQTKELAQRDKQIALQAQAIKFKDTKLERIAFELARL